MPRAAPVTIAIFISSISIGYLGWVAISEKVTLIKINFDKGQWGRIIGKIISQSTVSD
jgi:hypothetical protein